jgi:hypothetical protein
MKLSRIGVTLFGAALLFTASAFAGNGNENKGTLRLDDKVSVGGTALNPGTYKVEWTGSGSDVQVTVSQGSQTVATFPAHVAQQQTAAQNDAYGSESQPNGDKTLTTLYFHGKHFSLEVGSSAGNQQAGAK